VLLLLEELPEPLPLDELLPVELELLGELAFASALVAGLVLAAAVAVLLSAPDVPPQPASVMATPLSSVAQAIPFAPSPRSAFLMQPLRK
ncbi:MAG: hypothetical protein ACREU6_15335, partial [Steroidobacteraceae bacterium]